MSLITLPPQRAKWQSLGIPGPSETLADVLLTSLSQGKELTEENWTWLFNHRTEKSLSLEDFKIEALRQVK